MDFKSGLMLFFIKKLFFKLMELGLGVKPCFFLETKDPIFINFKLSPEESAKVQASLPKGFTLDAVRFENDDETPHYWISYNLYEIRYPKKELRFLRKVRCEINTFVTDAKGRKGIYVFCGSPYVSKEKGWNFFAQIADLAERLVIWIYGTGKLLKLHYLLEKDTLAVELYEKEHRIKLCLAVQNSLLEKKLSSDYWKYNDISFFNQGKTYDLVNTNSHFTLAELSQLPTEILNTVKIKGPFFDRTPDALYFHRGSISYLVSALNRMETVS